MKKAIPKEWKVEHIGNLCEVGRGSSPRPIADTRYFEGGTIPWIKIADATKSGKYLYETKEKVNEYGSSFSRLLPRGSLIVAASGTLGHTQFLGVEGCIHDGWLYLTNYRGVDRNFLYYFFKWKVQFFYNSAYGAAIQNINTDILREMEIVLPPTSIQEKIASILSAYDDLIENNNRRIKISEEMAQAIYKEWFVNFRFPGNEKVKMVKSKLGIVPEGWEVAKIGELLRKVERKLRVKKEDYLEQGEIPAIDQGAEFIGGYTNDYDALHDNPLPIIVFGDHTRIIKYVDFPFASGADGTQLLYPKNEELMPAYFYYAVRNIDLSNFAYARHFKFLKEQEVLIPNNPTLKLFNENVGLFLKQMSIFRKRNDTLRKTRDLLLPKLISGEVDVEKMDIKIVE